MRKKKHKTQRTALFKTVSTIVTYNYTTKNKENHKSFSSGPFFLVLLLKFYQYGVIKQK